MKRIYRIKDGFSLMEMMVVMLVVAIVMALSAPMITKKTGSAGGSSCLWTSLTGGNIGLIQTSQQYLLLLAEMPIKFRLLQIQLISLN